MTTKMFPCRHPATALNSFLWDNGKTVICKAHHLARMWARGLGNDEESEEAVERKANEIFEGLKPTPRRKLFSSPKKTDVHIYRYGSKWFSTQKAADDYRDSENLRQRVKRAGLPFDDDGIRIYEALEAETKRMLAARKASAEEARRERDQLREELGLHPKAHVTRGLARQNMAFSRNLTSKVITPEEKIALIRGLYDDKNNSLTDILIKTAQLVGVEISSLKGRK